MAHDYKLHEAVRGFVLTNGQAIKKDESKAVSYVAQGNDNILLSAIDLYK